MYGEYRRPIQLPMIPAYLHGFGGFGQDQEDWLTKILTPIANTMKQYFDIQAQGSQAQITRQTTVAQAEMNTTTMMILAGLGIGAFFLFKGKKSSKPRGHKIGARKTVGGRHYYWGRSSATGRYKWLRRSR